MPIPQVTQVNPLDLQGNIAIGISLPFTGPSGPFNSTYDTISQIKSNLINLLLTNKGERIMNPDFGSDLKRVLFEGIVEDTSFLIKDLINNSVSLFMPEIRIMDILIDPSPNYNNNNTISITIQYQIRLSGTPGQITVQFI
jgi:phage baseplate assembly protein W